jgi:hypothetical protein
MFCFKSSRCHGLLLITLLCLRASAADSGDWPMFRHDPLMTGRSTIKGNLQGPPQVLAKYDLAGIESLFMIKASHALSSTPQPRNVREAGAPSDGWEAPPKKIDLYGDGKLVPPPEGDPPMMGGKAFLVEKILKGTTSYQSLTWKDYYSERPTAVLEMRNYVKAKAEPDLVWRSSPPEGGIYETLIPPVDVNGDGQIDIVMATHYLPDFRLGRRDRQKDHAGSATGNRKELRCIRLCQYR